MATTRALARISGLGLIEPGSAGRCDRRIDILPPVLGCVRIEGELSAHDGRPMLGGDPDRSRYLGVGMGYFGTVVWAALMSRELSPPTLLPARGGSEHPCYTDHRFANGLRIGPTLRTGQFPSHTLADPAIHGARRAPQGARVDRAESKRAEERTGGSRLAATSMKQLLEAGVHFGHQTRRWNPKMRPFIFAERNGIHIIDLAQTVSRLEDAPRLHQRHVRRGDSVLFVGTKKQAQESIAAEAERSGQHYVNNRWLGGMLTNFTTIKRRIQRLEALEARREAGEFERLTKKEASKLSEEIEKLNHALGGIRACGGCRARCSWSIPHRESIAVAEARRLEIPIVAMTDTNCDPDLIDWVIPANDDAIRSVRLICEKVADAVLAANQERQARLDEEFEQAEALPPVDEAALAEDTDYTAALAAGEALVFEPEPEEDEEEERRARARRAAEAAEDESEPEVDAAS